MTPTTPTTYRILCLKSLVILLCGEYTIICAVGLGGIRIFDYWTTGSFKKNMFEMQVLEMRKFDLFLIFHSIKGHQCAGSTKPYTLTMRRLKYLSFNLIWEYNMVEIWSVCTTTWTNVTETTVVGEQKYKPIYILFANYFKIQLIINILNKSIIHKLEVDRSRETGRGDFVWVAFCPS